MEEFRWKQRQVGLGEDVGLHQGGGGEGSQGGLLRDVF